MKLDPEEMTPVLHRVKRAHGHLGRVVAMMEEGRDCEEVVTQFAAVLKALDKAAYALVATGMKQCLTASQQDGHETMDVKAMEKLFLSLA